MDVCGPSAACGGVHYAMINRTTAKTEHRYPGVSGVDLFCGAGGLTRGLLDAGVNVVAGVDLDAACQHPYEHNNHTHFLKKDVSDLSGVELASLYPDGDVRLLVGCAPCQPFSRYTQGLAIKNGAQWGLLRSFARIIREVKPELVSMENVPELQRHSVFDDFVANLRILNYNVSFSVVYCPDYGIPQQRSRLVLFASRFGPIEIIRPTHSPRKYHTVRSAIACLNPLEAGAISLADPLHRASRLSPLNLRRIRASRPGGSWRDWAPDLVAACHRKKNGKSYPSVYGRMEWDSPSPTITTQFFGFGNGRFGHPEQDRGISLREGAILQTFPPNYEFVPAGAEFCFKTIGRLIGNAVPVRLGRAIGRTVQEHLRAL